MTGEIAVTYQQTLFSFVWYTVEFIANIAVIYYVAYTVGWVKPPRLVRTDVPTAMNDTWSQTGNLLNNAVGIAQRLNTALNATGEAEEGDEKTKGQKSAQPKKAEKAE